MPIEYWLISTPTEKNEDESWRTLQKIVTKVKGCFVYKFYVPNLKVGTLDSLITDADELAKLDMFLESLINRLASSLAELTNANNEDIIEQIHIDGQNLYKYLVSFKWDVAKYPIKQSIRIISDLIKKIAISIDQESKKRLQDYITIRNAYENLKKNDQKNLLTKDLSTVVSPNDILSDSRYLTTLLTVVPKKLLEVWYDRYEHIDDTVIPRSSRMIAEDAEYYLMGVSLFKNGVENFKNRAKPLKFVVRDYYTNETQYKLQKKRLDNMKQNYEEMIEPLLKSLRNNINELFKGTIHVKTLRIFVESVLRYGLPAAFRGAIVIVEKKSRKKMRDALCNLYKHLDAAFANDLNDKLGNVEAFAAIGHNPADYFPYVCCKVITEIL